MSIIHDALKKVQERLNPKTEAKSVVTPTTTPETSGYLYETSPALETLPGTGQETINQKIAATNKMKTIYTLCGALVIITASVVYLYYQFQSDIPKVQRLASKSFATLTHKEPTPDFKAKAPQELKSMAQVTIATNSPTPITLNIHGIMSNTGGNLVLINDQVYQEGDTVDGAKITKINLDSISIINNGIEKTILVKN